MEPRVAAQALPIASRPIASRPRRDRRVLRHLSTVLLAIVLSADVVAVVLVGATIRAVDGQALDPTIVAILILTASYAVVGWIIASRRPDNRIGWVFLVIGLSLSIEVSATAYAKFGLQVSPGSLPFADLMSWVAVWAWAPGFTFLLTLSVLLFPDGRPPTVRWRPVVWASFLMLTLLLVPMAVASWPYRGLEALNLLPSTSQGIAVATALQILGVLISPFVAIASIAGMVVRFRRADRIERQQLKWFGFAAVAVIVFVLVVSAVTPPAIIVFAASILIAPLLPAAAAIAILRYRLYDLDRIVSRTIAYATVTGLLVVVFAGGILVFQELLAPVHREERRRRGRRDARGRGSLPAAPAQGAETGRPSVQQGSLRRRADRHGVRTSVCARRWTSRRSWWTWTRRCARLSPLKRVDVWLRAGGR